MPENWKKTLNQKPNNNKQAPHLYLLFLGLLLNFLPGIVLAQTATNNDRRESEIRHLDLDYTKQLRQYRTREEWLSRAESLRKQILVSAGLWPQPTKQPIQATLSEKIDRGSHTIEKVYFESFPGHYVSGNLYRPKNVTGKVPAVLLPHGHWT